VKGVVDIQIAVHAEIVFAFRTSACQPDKRLTHRYRLVGLIASSTWFTPSAAPTSASWNQSR